MPNSEFEQILEKWKNNVLQLDNRNPLINFSPRNSTHPRQAVEIDPKEFTFSQLVEHWIQQKGLVFDYARRLADPFDLDDDNSNIHEEKHELSSTDENPLDLQRKLGLLRAKDQLWEQEQGLNVLFLCFGTIHWTDHEKDEKRRSPLLLFPCDLERNSPQAPFHLFAEDDLPELNETLRVKFE
tara:strand:- start:89 stop:637 length:549 start_codon:yes stop_codon:yes gene_type:complete